MNCHFHIIYMDLVDLLEESWMEWDSLKKKNNKQEHYKAVSVHPCSVDSVWIRLKIAGGYSVLSQSKWLCKYYIKDQTLLE